jgi:hypothetical protein
MLSFIAAFVSSDAATFHATFWQSFWSTNRFSYFTTDHIPFVSAFEPA